MKIGIVIGRIGGEDGVALETEKWVTVLERIGHRIVVLAGALEGDVPNVELMPELAFEHPDNQWAQEVAFFGKSVDEEHFKAELELQIEKIASGVERWIEREAIDCLLSENSNALPFHLATGMALRRVCERREIEMVAHEHDFAWERGDRYQTPFAWLEQQIEQAYPPKLPNIRHAVINSPAKAAIADRCGIDRSIVVPNVMDFDQPFGELDAYNGDLRQALGVGAEDTLLFQITRIVRRKGIETAVDLVHRLNDPSVKLVITGSARDEHGSEYVAELRAQVARLGLGQQVLFAGELFDNQRREEQGKKVYSLSDAYAHATACTYFSTYEGFGNAYVEAVVAKVPVFVNNYEPVYWPDIGSHGFRTVQIEKSVLTDEAVALARRVILESELRQSWVEENYTIGRKYFSYQALERLLRELF